MISNQILQNTIDGLKGITRIDLCIIDVEGKVLAATFPEADQYIEPAQAFVESPADSQVVQGHQFFKIYDELQVEYVLVAKGSSDDVYMIGKMAAFQIQNLLVAYKERFDKDNFIKNLLLDILLLVDIYNRAKKLRIDTETRRVVFIVETKYEKDNSAMETIKSLYASKPKDYITAIDEKNIIIVKEIKEGRRGRIKEYVDAVPTAKYTEGKGIWTIPCDIALPCATQNELQLEGAEALVANGCYAVAEGANMPSTPEAIAYLQSHGILFAPAKAANAGGVATSGLEMSQNSLRLSWTFEEVDERLHNIMVNIYKNAADAAERYGMKGNLVAGANIAGFEKIASAMMSQGIV